MNHETILGTTNMNGNNVFLSTDDTTRSEWMHVVTGIGISTICFINSTNTYFILQKQKSETTSRETSQRKIRKPRGLCCNGFVHLKCKTSGNVRIRRIIYRWQSHPVQWWSDIHMWLNDHLFPPNPTPVILKVILEIHIHAWWRHKKETFSALLALCAGNSPVSGEIPAQRPVMQKFDIFFDLRLNERFSKQSLGQWFETPPRSFWRHCNAKQISDNK